MLHTDHSTDLLTTGAAGRIAGRAAETIRSWANAGLLPLAARTESGVRLYRREDVERVAMELRERRERR
jgi:DNA-binding transcriptional MerR regulator